MDVIVERWQSFTGRQATLVGTGLTFAQVRAHRAKARATPPEPAGCDAEQPIPTVRIRTRTIAAKSEGK